MKIYVLSNPDAGRLEYDLGGNTFYLEAGDTKTTDFGRAQHILSKFQMRGVTLREES